jgi:hypothetical protein
MKLSQNILAVTAIIESLKTLKFMSLELVEKKVADKIDDLAWEKICKLEKLAREHGVDLDFQTKENEEKK